MNQNFRIFNLQKLSPIFDHLSNDQFEMFLVDYENRDIAVSCTCKKNKVDCSPFLLYKRLPKVPVKGTSCPTCAVEMSTVPRRDIDYGKGRLLECLICSHQEYDNGRLIFCGCDRCEAKLYEECATNKCVVDLSMGNFERGESCIGTRSEWQKHAIVNPTAYKFEANVGEECIEVLAMKAGQGCDCRLVIKVYCDKTKRWLVENKSPVKAFFNWDYDLVFSEAEWFEANIDFLK